MPRLLFQYPKRVKGRDYHLDFQGESVTPSDSVDLPSGMCQGLAATTAGNIAIQLDDDSTAVVTIAGTALLEPYLVQASRVLATGTTATGIYALYAGQTFGN